MNYLRLCWELIKEQINNVYYLLLLYYNLVGTRLVDSID